MNGRVDNLKTDATREDMIAYRCSQCGSVVHPGRDLIADGEQHWCDGCYRLMLNPGSGGDIPFKWF